MLTSKYQKVLTPSAGELNLDKLAQLANRIVKASPMRIITTSQLTAQLNDLAKRLDELTSTLSNTINNFTVMRST